ncbi:hypothetical protein POTOM_026709 [Populus tomentosa]|uniref:Uncharacterized protein n=1 Tax=Populus tomentosa TaxID=118781 RepID=A0A8X7ZEE3_POPTO|nr:hypothetical protein POTOM_026709 [Populus tomentosa]
MAVEVPFDLLGLVQHQLQHFQVEDIKQDYETVGSLGMRSGVDGSGIVTFVTVGTAGRKGNLAKMGFRQLTTMMAMKMVFSSVGSEGNLAFGGGGTS